MIEITFYAEKGGEVITSSYNGKEITEENIDFVLTQLISNFGFYVSEIKKDGKILTDDEIEDIREKYSCRDKYDEIHNYFYPNQKN